MSKRISIHHLALALAALPACWLALAEPPRLDLPDAISSAQGQNRALARTVLSLNNALFNLRGARLPFELKIRPEISAGAEDGSETGAAGVSISRKTLWGAQVQLAAQMSRNDPDVSTNMYQGTVKAEIQQPLFRDFGPLINAEPIVQAESNAREARRLVEMQRADLVVAVVETYMDLLLMEQEIKVAEEASSRMNKLLQLTKAREQMGLTTRVDTLRAELQYRRTEAGLKETGERFSSRMRDLDELLGLAVTNAFQLAAVPYVEEEYPEPDDAAAIAFSNRLDYAQALQDQSDAARGVNVANRRLWPNIRLTLSYQKTGQGADGGSAASLGDGVWFAGIAGDTDLSRSDEQLALSRSVNEKVLADNNLETVTLSIAKQVRQNLSACRRARDQVGLALETFRVARDRRDLARKLFEMGRGDNFSVTDAENACIEAEKNLLARQAEVTVSGYRLRRVLGTLIDAPADLKPAARAPNNGADRRPR